MIIKVRGGIMDSRSNRYRMYENNDNENQISSTRSSRNKKLYKEIYGRYDSLENLPLEDNTDEIDMEKLRELVSTKKMTTKEFKCNFNPAEQRKRNIDEQNAYDINKILEKAKYENEKLKENTTTVPKINKQILSTLQSTELSLDEIKKASKQYQESKPITGPYHDDSKKTDDLSMTREIKYQNLVSEKEEKSSDLSLDLFEDLKPMGNTIITKPIQEDFSKERIPSPHSEDTTDIDVIKPSASSNQANDFFTSSYEFSKKDFMPVDDDFSDLNKKGGILKIILLFLMIFIIGGVITYFVINYGIGMS